MKKFKILSISILLFFLAVVLTTVSHAESYDGFTYIETSTNITITGYTGSDKEITIPDSINGKPVKTINARAFSDSDITSVLFPSQLTLVRGSAFQNCPNLSVIDFSNVYTECTLQTGAFSSCANLTKIITSGCVSSRDAFNECPNLTDILYKTNNYIVFFINPSTLQSCEVSSTNQNYRTYDGIIYDYNYSEICSFPNNKENVSFPHDFVISVNSIHLQYPKKIKTFNIGDNVLDWPDSSVYTLFKEIINSYNPESIIINENHKQLKSEYDMLLTKDGTSIVWISPNQTTITVDKNVKSLPIHYCPLPSLLNFKVDKDNKYYCAIDGVLFSKDKTTLIKYPGNKASKKYVVPAYVSKIYSAAFYNSEHLQTVVIPGNVNDIGVAAFAGCSNLSNIMLSDGIAVINCYTFAFCPSLKYIKIPNSVTHLEDDVFTGDSIDTITLPNGLKSVGQIFRDAEINTLYLPSSLCCVDTELLYSAYIKNIVLHGNLLLYEPPMIENLFYRAGSDLSYDDDPYAVKIKINTYGMNETESEMMKSVYESYKEAGIKYNIEFVNYFNGVNNIDGKKILIINNIPQSGWATLNGKKYYTNTNGVIYTGFKTVDTKKYYFQSDGTAIANKLVTINGKKYYFGKDGSMYTSRLISVNGKKYYMGKDGVAYTKRLISVNGKKYYMGKDGVAYTSKLASVDGKKYYFGKDGVAYKSKLISVSGKKYYIGKDCVAYKSKFASLNGKKYYFGSDCVMYRNRLFSVNGVKWKADFNGVCRRV